MTAATTHDVSTGTVWESSTTALAGGLSVAGFMFYLLAAVQTPGLDPPPESVALFLVATTVAVVSYLLVRAGSPLGYPVAILAGLTVFAVVAVILAGVYGPAGSETNPVGPIVYVGLAALLILTAGQAWRGREAGTTTRARGTRSRRAE